jgi:hypothetical protein
VLGSCQIHKLCKKMSVLTRLHSCFLFYNSGDLDMVIPYVGTHAWIKSLNLTVSEEWEPWFVDGQVAGLVST